MDPYEAWSKALKSTEIIRPRVQGLQTFGETPLPYILLSESSVNLGDTVVRSGQIVAQQPSLILPPNIPQFSGFEFEKIGDAADNTFINLLLVRGIQMPSWKYSNHTVSLQVFEGRLSEAVRHYRQELQQAENVHCGLIAGPEDCWPFSLLIYVCSQIVRNSDQDIRKLLEEYRKKQ